MRTPGKKFRRALEVETPLQIIGTPNAYCALMAKKVGFQALYLSGAGVANVSYGLPDLGLTTLDNVLTDAQRILEAVDLPLLVDIDTGWGNRLMIQRTIRMMECAGVAAVHIEDQTLEKRCGHRAGKQLVSTSTMVERLKAALDTRQDSSFVIMARCDAYGVEGLEKTIERCKAYEEAGADMHFIEALSSLEEYQQCARALNCPILANVTEFGKTPLYTREELGQAGVKLILYPLSAARVMHLAALKLFKEIRQKGTQKYLQDQMQTRDELYGFLDYEKYEREMDHLLKSREKHE